jgi:hypothetical protein
MYACAQFVGGVSGVLLARLAALAYRAWWPAGAVACAKLNHDSDEPCPFRCHFAARGIHVPSLMRGVER